mmetsp:Transcript_3917/g.7214  ORF Transcript_3917/g.7214 Transcript_3917/m.7214 type:complete len:200 (+) Transcript_3917:169-768(+)|eukprot:CAMPEP_0197537214 /NCGR_PEP_ID=MMETSP1318-20131121/56174_1 /TAXON_ID=552666 /ORGANISM="Partenskyella glossopodia, Strain RCC365" /LENGTH=199 /DNA_ID=CAMNT_0043095337 /DNA_START=122 /DNA_END=721 /DNA_ORIENTATION=-
MGCSPTGMGMSAPELNVQVPKIDPKKAMEAVKDTYTMLEKEVEKKLSTMKFPFKLHEKGDEKNPQLATTEEKDGKWTALYLVASDMKVVKKVADKLWKTVIKPIVDPVIDASVNEATGSVEGWDSLPGFIQKKAKAKAKETAEGQAREQSKFDGLVQEKMFSNCLDALKEAGAKIFSGEKKEEVVKDEAKEKAADEAKA